MSDYVCTVVVGDTTFVAEPLAPWADPSTGVLDGITASWATQVLPPVMQPSTLQLSFYDDGSSAAAGGGWLPLEAGMQITVHLEMDGDSSWVPIDFTGRISDVSAYAHKRGGMVFTCVCTDTVGDLATMGSPQEIGAPVSDLESLALDLQEYGGFGLTIPSSPNDANGVVALDNVAMLDALNMVLTSWSSVSPLQLPVYLTAVPGVWAEYEAAEYDPGDDSLAGVLEFHLDGAVWRLVVDPGYYTDGGTGMVVGADQVEWGPEWRKTKAQAINTIELQSAQGAFSDATQTKRRTITALVVAYGVQSRSLVTPVSDAAQAISLAYSLLGSFDDVQLDYGLTSCVLVWETLTSDQRDEWAARLWPTPTSRAPGAAMAITGIPDVWRLINAQAVFSRVMGVTHTLMDGRLRSSLTLRGIPTMTDDGITWADLPALMTWASMDPAITWQQLSLVKG